MTQTQPQPTGMAGWWAMMSTDHGPAIPWGENRLYSDGTMVVFDPYNGPGELPLGDWDKLKNRAKYLAVKLLVVKDAIRPAWDTYWALRSPYTASRLMYRFQWKDEFGEEPSSPEKWVPRLQELEKEREAEFLAVCKQLNWAEPHIDYCLRMARSKGFWDRNGQISGSRL